MPFQIHVFCKASEASPLTPHGYMALKAYGLTINGSHRIDREFNFSVVIGKALFLNRGGSATRWGTLGNDNMALNQHIFCNQEFKRFTRLCCS